jgi:hypothetical protein
MQTQAKFAYGNVKGEDFYQLHLLFDSIAEHVEDAVDLIAERVTAVGGRAHGTARQVAATSSIKEYDLNVMHGMDHVRALLDHLLDVANAARQALRSAPLWEMMLLRTCSPRSFAPQIRIFIFCSRICRAESQLTVIESVDSDTPLPCGMTTLITNCSVPSTPWCAEQLSGLLVDTFQVS